MKWYIMVLQNYAGFQGRAGIAEFWMFFLFNIIFSAVAYTIDVLLGSGIIVTLIYFFFSLIPGLAVWVRRLHDINKCWANVLWILVPVAGQLYMIFLLAKRGSDGDNKFGPSPE